MTELIENDTSAALSTASHATAARQHLTELLVAPDPHDGLLRAVHEGFFDPWIPEIAQMEMEQDPIHRHKDVLTHTAAVTSKTPPQLRVRLAALLHDVGKPATRKIGPEGVTFRHHEAVGARIAERRLSEMGFDPTFVDEVTHLVALSGRFKGYANGWSDSAVRRYARDAGPLLGDLNTLVRCDCTTRNPRKVESLHSQLDDLESRIRVLALAEELHRQRPVLSGDQIMELLDIGPGPLVGAALDVLKRATEELGPLDERQAIELLRTWSQEAAAHDSRP